MNRKSAAKEKEYRRLFNKQDGKCAICDRDDVELFLDHDHECCRGKSRCGMCYRGLLCHSCNLGMGDFDAVLRGALIVSRRYVYFIAWYYPDEAKYVTDYLRSRAIREGQTRAAERREADDS